MNKICACWTIIKPQSKYCIKCGHEINTLRSRAKTAIDKDIKEKFEILLKEKLIYHGSRKEQIKTKTTKIREKRLKKSLEIKI